MDNDLMVVVYSHLWLGAEGGGDFVLSKENFGIVLKDSTFVACNDDDDDDE